MDKRIELANLLFPNNTLTMEDLAKRYPQREGNPVVTRFAPSPTGFLHIGGVYTALMNRKLAHQSPNGIFMLRIEDTDKKREVCGSKGIICEIFRKFGVAIDEGVISETAQKGEYGSYIQSERTEIYHAVAKYLVETGFAYPCFCSEEELNQLREAQEAKHLAPGYYRECALYRDQPLEVVKQKLAEKGTFVLRFRVPDNVPERIHVEDLIKGSLEMENNLNDFVLLKENGIPTYHFAHCCDDHYMGTTIVMRGDEWISSLPIHLQLFDACGFALPQYAHVAPIMKLDGESRRKLSKRKDPESSAEFYLEMGYPIKALFVYLYTLINSNFEEWYLANPNADLDEFEMSFANMSISGALYDLAKLNNISSEIIYQTSVEDNLTNQVAWAKAYDQALLARLEGDLAFAKRLFETQGENSHEHRKDLACYHDYLHVFGSLYSDIFEQGNPEYQALLEENLPSTWRHEIIDAFIAFFKEMQTGSEKTLKDLSKELGFVDKKKYAKDPTAYRGIITQFYKGLRLLLTHQEHGISMDDIILVLGYDEVIRRLEAGK